LYEAVKAEREQAKYPPFVRLVNIVLSSTSLSSVKDAAMQTGDVLSTVEGVVVLGPTSCPLERLQGRWRQHLLLKLPAGSSVDAVGEAAIGLHWSDVTMMIDVDPQALM
jgi:primosomal protein N'